MLLNQMLHRSSCLLRRHPGSLQSCFTPLSFSTKSKSNPLPTESFETTISNGSQKRSHMAIRAVHLGRKMNIVQLFQRLYNTDRYKVSHYLHTDSIVLKLRDGGSPSSSSNNSYSKPIVPHIPHLDPPDSKATTTDMFKSKEKWVVYFDYGAVVFFNCESKLTDRLVNHAKKFTTDVFEMRGHDEELMLIADPALRVWSQLRDSSIVVQAIDHVNVQVIAGVLAQTVALEHYERQVDAILGEFERLNSSVEHGQHSSSSSWWKQLGIRRQEREQHRKLFEIVATNNRLLIDLVNKLRVIDRKRPGDAAWDQTRYHSMWENLREEFELNERFNNINFKLELIQHNTKFFLEFLGAHKGERLEWYIILLISAELAVSIYELLMK